MRRGRAEVRLLLLESFAVGPQFEELQIETDRTAFSVESSTTNEDWRGTYAEQLGNVDGANASFLALSFCKRHVREQRLPSLKNLYSFLNGVLNSDAFNQDGTFLSCEGGA